MKKKILSVILILLLTLMITVDLYKEQAVAVAPAVVLIPAATYAIYCGLAAAGVLGNNASDHSFIANDYITKISDYEKALWNNVAKYGLAAGSMVINGVLAQSLSDYVTDRWLEGSQVVTLPGEQTNMSDWDAGPGYEISDGLGNITNISVAYDGYRYNYYYYKLTVGENEYLRAISVEATSYSSHIGKPIYDSGSNTWSITYGINLNGSVMNYGAIIIAAGANAYIKGPSIDYNYIGDTDGLGVALSAAGSIAINLPSSSTLGKTLDQVEADQALADWLEAEMNKVNKTNKPNWGGPGGAAAAIAALTATSYYWLDPLTKEITQTTTQTPPPGEDLIPLPAPGTQTIPVAPSLPDNYPTEDNPEIKTKLSDPIITTIDNGDGTHTETKTQEETKTERYYDPDSQRWIEKTTKTKTTTTTDIDDQTGDRTETGRTTETLPDGNTTETPPPKDATDIDWGPLKQSMYGLTNKFPFSLPWDLYNTYVQFIGDEWNGIIEIDIHTPGVLPIDWDFDIDFSMFDGIRQIVKQIELILFDIGLILTTRKLMGGGV